METWSGGCQCGAIRYEVVHRDVLTLVCCHCRECQRQSSSAFGMSLILPRAAFRITRGVLANWDRSRDLDETINRANFCPTCGVRIFHDRGEGSSEVCVKAGSLDDTSVLNPAAHLWTKRAQSWIRLPNDVLRYDDEPETETELNAAYRDVVAP